VVEEGVMVIVVVSVHLSHIKHHLNRTLQRQLPVRTGLLPVAVVVVVVMVDLLAARLVVVVVVLVFLLPVNLITRRIPIMTSNTCMKKQMKPIRSHIMRKRKTRRTRSGTSFIGMRKTLMVNKTLARLGTRRILRRILMRLGKAITPRLPLHAILVAASAGDVPWDSQQSAAEQVAPTEEQAAPQMKQVAPTMKEQVAPEEDDSDGDDGVSPVPVRFRTTVITLVIPDPATGEPGLYSALLDSGASHSLASAAAAQRAGISSQALPQQ
jgi:hypothetical protein